MSNNKTTIQVLTASSTLLNDWDEYVMKHVDSSPYHLSAWLKSVEQAYKHPCYFVVALQGVNVVGLLPLCLIAPPLMSGVLCSLPFCDVGGCLADNEDIKNKLLDKANELRLQNKAKKIEYRATGQYDPEADLSHCKVRMLLELPENSEALMASFKSKLRSQIRKAEKNGLRVELGRSEKFVDGFYKIFCGNMHRLGSPVHSKAWFEAISQNYTEQVMISLVYYNDLVVGAGLILSNGAITSIPWASTDFEYNKLAPNMLLYWSLLEYSTDNGSKIFDFGRSTFEEGTYKFKKQWGAQAKPLDWKDIPAAPVSDEQSQPSKLRPMVENTWKKLPLGLTKAVGPKVRKYISL